MARCEVKPTTSGCSQVSFRTWYDASLTFVFLFWRMLLDVYEEAIKELFELDLECLQDQLHLTVIILTYFRNISVFTLYFKEYLISLTSALSRYYPGRGRL
jgi:hypothetical protein